jgi:ABC-2 type transport system ATP-binding protein
MMNIDTILSLSNISKTYKKQGKAIAAVKDISLRVGQGDILGILGPNGSGKTTLIKIITGLCMQDRGHVEWHTGANIHRSLGVLLEGRSNLMERLSTLENAKYYCALRQCRFSPDLFHRLSGELGLADVDCAVRKLSTGNKLRSALILALIHRPALVLLDEPTTGMDASGVRQLEAVVTTMAKNGCGFIITSHDLEFIDRICEKIICLSCGRVVFEGEKRDFQKMNFNYKVHISLRPASANVGLVPKNGSQLIKNHEALCAFLSDTKETIASADVLEIKKITLREKYEELLEKVK